MPQRRAQPRGGGEHGGDAGQDADVESVRVGSPLQRLEKRRGHGKDPRIAGGDDDDAAPPGGHVERMVGAVQFHPVVGRMQGQPVARGDTGDIGDIADDVGRPGNCRAHLIGHKRLIPRPEARDGDPAAHGRRPWPWTTAMEKYGTFAGASDRRCTR